MNEFQKIIIDQDNYKYLVRKELPYYRVSLCYGIPRKTDKGYLGWKSIVNDVKIKNKEGAQQLFANWKEEFLAKFYRKEILTLRLSYQPVCFYNVTCPYCGKDAEIQDFIMLFGTDFPEHFPIVCRHCNGTPEEIYSWVTIGECQFMALDKTNEEKKMRIRLDYQNSGIKYEDFVKNPEILKLFISS
jgi:hypothetical protein